MNIIFYLPETTEVGKRIQKIVEKIEFQAETEVYRDMDGLSYRLRQPKAVPTIATILAATQKDLKELTSIQHLLSGIPTVVILPDREKETTAVGYTFSPRFLTYVDSNLDEIVAVLDKMVKYYNHEKLINNFSFSP